MNAWTMRPGSKFHYSTSCVICQYYYAKILAIPALAGYNTRYKSVLLCGCGDCVYANKS